MHNDDAAKVLNDLIQMSEGIVKGFGEVVELQGLVKALGGTPKDSAAVGDLLLSNPNLLARSELAFQRLWQWHSLD